MLLVLLWWLHLGSNWTVNGLALLLGAWRWPFALLVVQESCGRSLPLSNRGETDAILLADLLLLLGAYQLSARFLTHSFSYFTRHLVL
jgi:hypothetical protein